VLPARVHAPKSALQLGEALFLAFDTLRVTSQSENRKLHHVAQEIVRTAIDAHGGSG